MFFMPQKSFHWLRFSTTSPVRTRDWESFSKIVKVPTSTGTGTLAAS